MSIIWRSLREKIRAGNACPARYILYAAISSYIHFAYTAYPCCGSPT